MQFADNTGPDQPAHLGLRCPLTESMDTVVESMVTVVYVDKLRMLRLDCTDAHADGWTYVVRRLHKGPFRALLIIC